MSNIFEINIAKELDIKELAVVAKRIEKYKKELEDTLTTRQKMILNNLLHNKSKAAVIIITHSATKLNNQNSLRNQTQTQNY